MNCKLFDLHTDDSEAIMFSVVSGFHRALLQSITFIGPLNALDYTKLRG